MPINIVRIHEVGDCVVQAIDDLNAKLWAANQRGHFVEMPEEMQFQMLVVKEWEVLESTDRQITVTTDNQGGFSTETQTSTGADITAGTDERRSESNNRHVQNTDSTQDNYGS
jgi:hypothetical protein